MNNDDSFNDYDEVFSLYSSKQVMDTFKAQLKRIAANNRLTKNCLNLNNKGVCSNIDKKNANQQFHSIAEKREPEIVPVGESAVIEVLKDYESVAPAEMDARGSSEDSIEIISDFTPRATRRSKRLRKKKVQSSCELNISSDTSVNKTAARKKKEPIKNKQKKTIEEILIDSSPLTEPEDELNPELSVKVIWKSVNVKKFKMRKFQKLSYIFEQLSKEENIPKDKIMLTFKNFRVNQSDTPDSLNLQVYHFLDGGVLSELSNSCQTPNSKSSECSDSVTLKFQDNNKRIIKLNVNKNEKLRVGMIKCSEQLEIPLNKIKFYFDGELLKPSATPDSLGLENEEIIDIKICG